MPQYRIVSQHGMAPLNQIMSADSGCRRTYHAASHHQAETVNAVAPKAIAKAPMIAITAILIMCGTYIPTGISDNAALMRY